MDIGHWVVHGEIPDKFFGFIYQITNLHNNKKYIGKKQTTHTIKRPPLKGKKRKRVKIVESDWKTYTGSNDALNKDIETLGKDNFHFEILRFCENKFELSYFEAKLQFEKDVLLNEEYYNGIINVRLPKKKNKK